MSGVTFEIQVKNGSRWSFHSYRNTEAEAVNEARGAIKQRIAEAAKVIKKDKGEETVIFDEDEISLRKKAALNHIDDSPVCQSLEDVFKDDSVRTLTHLLRDYCDQEAISPTELMHNHRLIEKFCDSTLFASGLDRLASLQAVKAQLNEKDRREELFDYVRQVQDLAQSGPFDELKKGELDSYLQNVGDLNDFKTRHRVMLSFTKETTLSPSFEGKFAILFELLGKDYDPEKLSEVTTGFLDDIFSEWLSLPGVVMDFLGQQPDRYNAISVLAKICSGNYEPRKWDTPALTEVSRILSKHPMSKTRSNLADRVENMLRNRASLTKGDIYEEKHAFKQLFPLFISKSGTILGGEGMAEALTMCATRSFNRDRNLEKPGEAIDFILENLQIPILQMRYLLILSSSSFGKDCADIIAEHIPSFMDGPEHVHDIVNYKLPLKRKLKIITTLQKQALKLDLPNKEHLHLVEWLDELLFNFLDEERIVDKMDSPEDTLYVRATQLLQFCASGLLIEGKTLSWVRERVQDHLRQPNFVEKFTEDVPTQKKKEMVITQLHAMLKKAGLQQ